jgi:hypothetical protein
MAIRFNFENVLDDDVYVNTFSNAVGLADKFLQLCKEIVGKTEFPNIDCEISEFVSGGWVFNKEKTNMLSLTFKKAQFDGLGVFFRAQQFGNVVVFSKYETIEKGFLDVVTGKSNEDKLTAIRRKCKNIAQWEEFVALRSLGDVVFWEALRTVDPAYEAKQKLAQLAPGSNR